MTERLFKLLWWLQMFLQGLITFSCRGEDAGWGSQDALAPEGL